MSMRLPTFPLRISDSNVISMIVLSDKSRWNALTDQEQLVRC
jgi:hypothetical protein